MIYTKDDSRMNSSPKAVLDDATYRELSVVSGIYFRPEDPLKFFGRSSESQTTISLFDGCWLSRRGKIEDGVAETTYWRQDVGNGDGEGVFC